MQRTVFRAALVGSFMGCAVLVVVVAIAVISAVRDARGPNRLIVPMKVAHRVDAQVFFDRGGGIRAQDCSTGTVPGGPNVTEVTFALPRESIRELRFDPMSGDGTFAIGAPRLESACERVIARFPLNAVVPRYQIAEFRREGDFWIGVTTAGANDPQLTIELGAPLRIGKPRIPWWESIGLALTLIAFGGLQRHPANTGWSRRTVREVSRRVCAWLSASGPFAVMVGFGVIAGVELARLWPLHLTLDWPLWDEVNYAGAGAQWARHGGMLSAMHESPLYLLSYAVLSRLGDLATAIFAQHYLVKLGSVLLLYILLARWTRSWLAAMAFALWLGAAEFQLEFPLLVYQSALAWFLLALVCIDRWPLAGLCWLAAAAAVRQEYQFVLLATVAIMVWHAWRSGLSPWTLIAARGRRGIGLAMTAGACALVIFIAARTRFGGSTGRLWFAFQQHYAARATAVGEVSGINPWVQYPAIVRRDFGDANSLSAAWRKNPDAVLKHLRYNLAHTGPELLALARTHSRIGGAAWWLAAGAIALLATRHRTSSAEPWGGLDLAVAGCGVIAAVPGLLVFAKGAYLLPVLPAVFGAVVLLARRCSLEQGRSWLLAAAGVAAVLAAGLEAKGPPVFVPGERSRQVAETVAALNAIWPEDQPGLLLGVAASSYAYYVGAERCTGLEPLGAVSARPGKIISLAESVADPRLHAVLVTNDWRNTPQFDQRAFDAILLPPAWRRREIGDHTLYWREAPE